jgi:uncharacterized protein (UPF0548 family)
MDILVALYQGRLNIAAKAGKNRVVLGYGINRFCNTEQHTCKSKPHENVTFYIRNPAVVLASASVTYQPSLADVHRVQLTPH